MFTSLSLLRVYDSDSESETDQPETGPKVESYAQEVSTPVGKNEPSCNPDNEPKCQVNNFVSDKKSSNGQDSRPNSDKKLTVADYFNGDKHLQNDQPEKCYSSLMDTPESINDLNEKFNQLAELSAQTLIQEPLIQDDENTNKISTDEQTKNFVVKSKSRSSQSGKSIGESNVCSIKSCQPNETMNCDTINEQREYILKLRSKLKYCPVVEKQEFSCYVTHAIGPLLFWIQLGCVQKEINKFANKLNDFYQNIDPLDSRYCFYCIEYDKLYAAQYSVDMNWYRAKIIDDSHYDIDQTITVFYIDYGNTEKLPADKIRVLDEKFYEYEVFAIPVSLENAFPISGRPCWTEHDNKEFINLANSRKATVKFRFVKNWPVFFCSLLVRVEHKQYEDALKYLIDRKIAVTKIDGVVMSKFKSEMRTLNYLYRLEEYNFGTTYTTYGQQQRMSSNQSTVSSFDNRHILAAGASNKISTPNGSLLVDAFVGSHKQNKKTPNCMSISENSCELLPLQMNTSTINLDSTIDSKLNALNFENFEPFNLNSLPKKYLELDDEGFITFQIVHHTTPNEFYISPANNFEDEFLKMESEMNMFYSKCHSRLADYGNVSNYAFVFVNSLCVAQSPQNKLFYRAQIKNIKNVSAKQANPNKPEQNWSVLVRYIDYGHTDKLDWQNLYPIANKYCLLPAFCVPCKLDLIIPKPDKNVWSEGAVNYFNKMVASYRLFRAKLNKKYAKSLVMTSFDKKLKIIILVAIGARGEVDLSLNEEFVKRDFARFTFMSKDNQNQNATLESESDRLNDTLKKSPTGNLLTTATSHHSLLPDDDFKQYRISQYVLEQAERASHYNECENEQDIVEDDYDDDYYLSMVQKERNSLDNTHDNHQNELIDDRLLQINSNEPEFVETPEKATAKKRSKADVNGNTSDEKEQIEIKVAKEESKNDIVVAPSSSNVNETKLVDAKITPKELENNNSSTQYDELNHNHKSHDNTQNLDDWNPKLQEFDSIKNFYGFDEKKPESRLLGYEVKYERNICRNYLKFKKCHKYRCPFLHKLPDTEIIGGKFSISPFYDCLVELEIPQNNFVLIEEIRFDATSSCFKGDLVGYFDMHSEITMKIFDFENLAQRMNRYYSNKKFLPEKTTVYYINQIVAVYDIYSNNWVRAKIIEIFEHDLDCNKNEYTIEYMDYFGVENINIKKIYPIKEEFLNCPFGQFYFRISDVTIIDKVNINSILVDLNKQVEVYFCEIKKFNDPYELNVYATTVDGNKEIDVKKYLIEKGVLCNEPKN